MKIIFLPTPTPTSILSSGVTLQRVLKIQLGIYVLEEQTCLERGEWQAVADTLTEEMRKIGSLEDLVQSVCSRRESWSAGKTKGHGVRYDGG